MHEPNHEEAEEIEDPEVDEQMDPGIRIPPQRHDEDETKEDIAHDEEPNSVERDET